MGGLASLPVNINIGQVGWGYLPMPTVDRLGGYKILATNNTGTQGLKSNQPNREPGREPAVLANRPSELTKFSSCELQSALLTKE